MDHDWELIIPDPGNIWKFDFMISSYPGTTGNIVFLYFLISWKYCKSDFFYFLISWKYWKIYVFYFLISWKYWNLKSSTFSLILEILENWIFQFPNILEILEICVFYILGFLQKRRAPKFHAGCTDGWAEISHMRPIQARKLKLFQTWISNWRRRRRRRRPNNSPIWPEP